MILPLEYFGTGIHHTIVIAAACTVLSDTLVCVEEPEAYLHPIMQRMLIRYLPEETSNQYLISTHSAQMLDSERANIFHVTALSGASTELRLAKRGNELSNICVELGYRPSDLLQSNAVVWVEGPSDRIYVESWLSETTGLLEGVHYSIMFYGGSLLAHLSAADEVDERLIALSKLNRFMVVVMDSDRSSAKARPNATKVRVRNELRSDPMTKYGWITSGYTIENYIPEHVLRAAVAELYAGRRKLGSHSKWVAPTRTEDGHAIDKVALARIVTSKWKPEEYGTDLRKSVSRVAELITRANKTSGMKAGADGSEMRYGAPRTPSLTPANASPYTDVGEV